MQRAKKNIAILLLLAFIFPIGYQGIHVYHHHDKPLEQNDLCSDISFSHAHCNDFIVISSEDSEACPICEYEFTTFAISEFQLSSEIVLGSFAAGISLYQNQYYGFNGTIRSLRAPPYHS